MIYNLQIISFWGTWPHTGALPLVDTGEFRHPVPRFSDKPLDQTCMAPPLIIESVIRYDTMDYINVRPKADE